MDIEVEPEYVSFAGWVKDDKEIYIINDSQALPRAEPTHPAF